MTIFLDVCQEAGIVCDNEKVFEFMFTLDEENRTAQGELDF
jgi:hypothetical protein